MGGVRQPADLIAGRSARGQVSFPMCPGKAIWKRCGRGFYGEERLLATGSDRCPYLACRQGTAPDLALLPGTVHATRYVRY